MCTETEFPDAIVLGRPAGSWGTQPDVPLPLRGLRLTHLTVTSGARAHSGLGRPLNALSGGDDGYDGSPEVPLMLGEGLAELPLRELHLDGPFFHEDTELVLPAGGCACTPAHVSPVRNLGCWLDSSRREPSAPLPAPLRLFSAPLFAADLWRCTGLTRLVVRGRACLDDDQEFDPCKLPPLDGARLPHLRALSLNACALWGGVVPAIVSAAPHLTALALTEAELWPIDDGPYMCDFPDLSRLAGLQELDLSGARYVSAGGGLVCADLRVPRRGCRGCPLLADTPQTWLSYRCARMTGPSCGQLWPRCRACTPSSEQGHGCIRRRLGSLHGRRGQMVSRSAPDQRPLALHLAGWRAVTFRSCLRLGPTQNWR